MRHEVTFWMKKNAEVVVVRAHTFGVGDQTAVRGCASEQLRYHSLL